MIQLKYDDHLFSISKNLFDDEYFSDIVFITKTRTFHGHLSLLLSHIPSLANLLCVSCMGNHEKIVIFLPDVGQDAMATALVEFYLKGGVARLKAILGEGNLDNEPAQLEKEEDNRDDTEISNDVSDNEITDVQIVNTQTTPEEFSEDTSKVTQQNEKNITSRNFNNGHDEYGIKLEENNRNKIFMTCDLCEKGYETVDGLKKHRRQVHGVGGGEEKLKHDCPYCGKIITYVNQHIRIAHKDVGGIFVCDVCRKTVGKDLNKHRRECTFCPLCGYENPRKSRLVKHIKTCKT